MQIKTLFGKGLEPEMQEIKIEAHGSGGAVGRANVETLVNMIQRLKEQKTPQDVYGHYCMVMGYCSCCVNAGFLDEKGGDEIMQMVVMLASKEHERAVRERRKGKA